MRQITFRYPIVNRLLNTDFSKESIKELTGKAHLPDSAHKMLYTAADVAYARSQLDADFSPQRMALKPLAVAMMRMTRGGVSKTTTCLNMALAMCLQGLRVCLLDGDPQANSTFSLGVNRDRIGLRTIYDLMKPYIFGENVVPKIPLADALIRPYQDMALELIPASHEMADADKAMAARRMDHKFFEKWLRDNAAALRSRFDVVLIDSGPAPSTLNLNFMIGSTHFVTPMSADGVTLRSGLLLNYGIDQMEELGYECPPIRVLATMVDRTVSESWQCYQAMRYQHGDEMFATAVPYSKKFLAQGNVKGEPYPLLEKDLRSDLAQTLIDLSREMMQWMELRGASNYGVQQ